MKKIFKLFLFLGIVTFFAGCQAVKDGLTLKKSSDSDEFLVEKKSPLVKPPEFDVLPVPETFSQKKENAEQEDLNFKNILNKEISKEEKKLKKEGINKKLESSILDKIKNN